VASRLAGSAAAREGRARGRRIVCLPTYQHTPQSPLRRTVWAKWAVWGASWNSVSHGKSERPGLAAPFLLGPFV
jgi:hypothetical protein